MSLVWFQVATYLKLSQTIGSLQSNVSLRIGQATVDQHVSKGNMRTGFISTTCSWKWAVYYAQKQVAPQQYPRAAGLLSHNINELFSLRIPRVESCNEM